MIQRYVIEYAGGLQIEESAAPVPGRGEVLVAMKAVSLNFRDHLILHGAYPLPSKDHLVPVSDGAGEIIAVGAGVTDRKVGDKVVTAFFPDWAEGKIAPERIEAALGGSLDGVLAQQVVLPARATLSYPEHLTLEMAATLPCAGVTAWNAVAEIGQVSSGDIVLLLGTGGVSAFALQFAKARGATVVQTSSSDAKLGAAQALGADHLINYHTCPDWDREVRRLTNGHGADLVVEVGGGATLERSLRATALGGTVAAIGLLSGLGSIDFIPLISGVVRLQGALVGSHAMYADMARMIAATKIEPRIDRVFRFAEAEEAFAYLAQGPSGKVVIRI